MDIRKFVMDTCAIQKQYADLYDEQEGLVSINPDYIHVQPEVMADLMSCYPNLDVVLIRRDDDEAYPLEANTLVNGVHFLSIGNFDNFRKYGLLKE